MTARPRRHHRPNRSARRPGPGCAGRCSPWPPTPCPALAASPPTCAPGWTGRWPRSACPLDIGPATETIPAHLRRAVTTRHPHCAFPGCTQPASVCDIHHIIARSRGGPTALHNLVTLCTFHHKIAVHRWGWHLRLNTDGTTTATGPGGQALHSHSPPSQAA